MFVCNYIFTYWEKETCCRRIKCLVVVVRSFFRTPFWFSVERVHTCGHIQFSFRIIVTSSIDKVDIELTNSTDHGFCYVLHFALDKNIERITNLGYLGWYLLQDSWFRLHLVTFVEASRFLGCRFSYKMCFFWLMYRITWKVFSSMHENIFILFYCVFLL